MSKTNHQIDCLKFLTIGLLFITGIAGFGACSPQYTGKANIGAPEVPTPGIPFINIQTSSNVDEDGSTQALIFLSIAENSLIYKKEKDSLMSTTEIDVEIHNKEGRSFVNKQYTEQFFRDTNYNYYEQKFLNLRKVYDIPPGEYDIRVTITDMNSGKQSTEESTIMVPDPESKSVHISNIRFLNKPSPSEPYFGVNGYSVNTGFDSLKFNFQVTNGREDFPVEIESKLYKFKSDTAPARPLSGRNYPSSYLESKGIDYTRSDLIQSTSRSLSNRGSVTIENSFTELSKGNYRFEVEAKTSDGNTFFEVRDFGVKSKNFPHVKTPRELARPLVYLMPEDDYNKLLQIQNADSLKSAIDAFWIQNIKNVPKAKRIIELYYDRVEQANIQFSNFKEGWKTDPGKIYILFGPPLYIDEGFGEMTWFYEFDSGNQIPSIQFKDPRFGNTKFPFDHYILNRTSNLFNLEYRQIQSWLDGSILYLSQ